MTSKSQLEQIILTTTKQPTIVNENSNFVVTTYWWGSGNYNQNTARPCVFFYETIIKTAINILIEYMIAITKTITKDNPNLPIDELNNRIYNYTFNIINKKQYNTPGFNIFIDKKAKDYNGMIYEYCKLDLKGTDLDQKSMIFLEKLKASGKTPQNFEYKNTTYVKTMLLEVIEIIYKICISEIITIYKINNTVSKLREEFVQLTQQTTGKLPNAVKAPYVNQLRELKSQKIQIFADITAKLKSKNTINENIQTPFASSFRGQSIYDILNSELKYLNAIKFEEMIYNWEQACVKVNCNYLSVEYPEFAQPGGYQMAINAKPLFIQKALSLCGQRGIVYIDGDMFIRKYPGIFDMADIDFMARGWNIDPRASDKHMEESILFDPYSFETSGGTMFFSQSHEATQLINIWVSDSAKPSNKGKADDRILSLVFNIKKLLFNMKIIQLPIEYLWLTLDYDDRLGSELYDYNMSKMAQTIFIEHPECLTSEDTAAGAGASSNRTPKFYSFIEKELFPTSEEFHEYLFFENKAQVDAFSEYLDYMSDKQYINDGNPDLIKMGYVDIHNPANNEQPLYIIKYDNKYGEKLYFKPNDLDEGEENYTINQIASINERRAENINISDFNLIDKDEHCVELNNINTIEPKILVSLLIRLLSNGKSVIYNPSDSPTYNIALYQQLINNKDNLYKSLEFVFTPINNKPTNLRSDLLKPELNLEQPMLFRPCRMLINYLKMFLSLKDMSNYISYSSYELISRTRIGLNIVKSSFVPQNIIGGGEESDIEQMQQAYLEGLNEMYPSTGGKRMRNIRKMYKYTRKRYSPHRRRRRRTKKIRYTNKRNNKKYRMKTKRK